MGVVWCLGGMSIADFSILLHLLGDIFLYSSASPSLFFEIYFLFQIFNFISEGVDASTLILVSVFFFTKITLSKSDLFSGSDA